MSGETALARQLSKLAVPQTSLLLQDKIKKSLLFDHREAAALDRDVFFSYGVNGFSKLRAIHPPFEKFEHILFDSSYVAYERGVQTTRTNRTLNRKIIEFLHMVSPYFLLQSSLEALEWLVYRFHIHQYNTDELMASVMPHYNTSTFVRVVQLLSLENPQHKWGWLKEVQKTGVHLEYGAVLNRFCTDGEFRKLVCEMAQSTFYVFKDSPSIASPVISFSMVTILNSLGRNQKIDDSDITFFFPYILNGIKSQFSKYVSGSYMVIFKIISSVQLKEDLVNDILIKVFENMTTDISEMAFKLLVTVFQRQSLKTMSKELFELLLSVEDFDSHLIYWSANCDCQALLNTLLNVSIPAVLDGKLKGTTSDIQENLYEFLPKILSSAMLTETTVLQSFHAALDWYSDLLATGSYQTEELSSVELVIKDTLKILEAKYPRSFDEAVSKYFKRGNKEELMKLVNDSMCNVKNTIVPKLKTTLVLGINHAAPEIRRSSLKYLFKLVKSGKVIDSDFIENSLYERLLDDFPIVVSEILSSSEVLFGCMDKKKIIVGFRHIFKQVISEKSPWYQIQMDCLDVISNHFSNEENLMFEILVTILPYIYPLQKQNIQGFKKLLDSQLKKTLPILQAFDSSSLGNLDYESEISEEQLSNLNFLVFTSARKYVERLDDASKSTFTTYLLSTEVDDDSSAYLTLYVYAVGQAVISFNCPKQKTACLQHLLKFLKSFSCNKVTNKDITMDERSLSDHCFESLSQKRFPGLIIYHTLNRIVKFVELNYDPIDTAPWTFKENNSLQASVSIFTMLFEFFIKPAANHKLKNTNILKNILNDFISSQFKTPQHLYAFLSLLWSNAHSNVSETIQNAALVTANSSCQDSTSSDCFFNSYPICICLLKAISSSNAEIRTSALTLLSTLIEKCESSNSPLKCLIEEIKNSSEEINIDHLQFFNVFTTWISPVADIYGQPNWEAVLESDISEDLPMRYSVLDNFLKVLADESTVSSIKCFLLQALHQTDSAGLLRAYLPLIEQFLQRTKENEEQMDKSSIEIFGLLIMKFTPKTASSLKEKSIEKDTFFNCLDMVGGKPHAEIQASLLKTVTREFFSAIPSVPVQKRLLKELLKLYVTSTSEASADLKKVLKKLSTFAYLILKDIHEKNEPEKKGTTLREVKKSRTVEPVNVNDSMMWKQITVILEMIQGKSKLENREILVPELFDLLGKANNLDPHSSVEYVKQLILSSIYNCCQHLCDGGLDERQFQVELVVQCIRSSTNPKTHHQSLLLLNLAATIFPEYVLNNVMSIFTFMGSSLIRQDDKYSIQVISQTIETIVPSLLAASNSKKENDAMQIVASMIRVFVDSLPDIPKHRQFPLFTKLITTLEPSKYLWIPLAQICDQYEAVFQYILSENVSPSKLSSTLEFAVNFHQQFSPGVQIDTCINMLQFLSQLPDFKEENAEYSDFTEPFNVANHSDKQLQKYKHNILSYINIWLSSQTFFDQVSDLDSKSQQRLEEKYELLLEKALHYLQHQRDLKPIADEEDKNNLFGLLYDLIGYINTLLPSTLFIRVVRRLLENPEPVIKKKAIELLNTKLEEQQHLFTSENHGYLLKLLKPLLKVAKEFEDNDDLDEHETVNQQTALYALHLLTKIIGSEYPKKFQKVLNLCIHVLKDKKAQELRVNALLCLAQLCVSLNIQVLPHLNTFMPIILDLLATFQTLNVDDCLILGVITALQSLVENLGMFLSIYLQSLVSGVSILYTKYSASSKSIIQEKLLAFQTLLAKDISLRILLPALEDSYSTLSSQDPDAVIPLMNLLEEKLGFSNIAEVESSSAQLQTFYILLLSFRSTHPESSVETVEKSIISAYKSFVVKLSVTRFRLFFQKTFQWMATSELKEPETSHLNVFTFYNLTNELSKTLKSLFNPAAKHFLKHAASQLDANNSSKNSELVSAENPSMITQLLNNIIDTLNVCFVHDDGLLLDKDSFESLMLPLVDQLENLQGGEAAYQDRVTNHLNTCVAHFMAAVSDNTLWKKLNYQVLMKTRHDLAVVRFAAIRAVREVAVVMGDNYLVLLPESIPFLAEVMEDESAEVERECQTVIEEMEKILGEPIRKYF